MFKISTQFGQIAERAGGLNEGFALLRRAGVEGIQFSLGMSQEEVRSNLPNALDQPLDAILEMYRPYKEAADRHGIAVTQVHAPFPMWAWDNETLNKRMPDIMIKSIAVTEYMESPYCVIHPAYTYMNRDRYTAKAEWEVNRKLYADMIPAIKKHKIMVLLENLVNRSTEGFFYAAACSDFHEACEWIDNLNAIAGEECFGFNFDTGHCVLARQNLNRAVHILGPRLKALHLQDNSGYRDDHRAPFTGVIDWESFLKALKDIGYRGDINFESHRSWFNYPTEMTEACLHMLALTGQYFRKRLTE